MNDQFKNDPNATSDKPSPGGISTSDYLPDESAGTMIGPYKLLQQLGKGGMGVVWMADQTAPVQRRVALKILEVLVNKAGPTIFSELIPNTKAMLGASLLGQKKHADAEPLLKEGYEGMKQREKTMPPQGLPRLTEALERLVQLYDATGNAAEADRYRKELAARKAAEKTKAPESECGFQRGALEWS